MKKENLRKSIDVKPNIGIFTVKKFRYFSNRYWTNGGFGDYIKSLLPHFNRIDLACHPVNCSSVPKGWYPLEDSKLKYLWLPYYERENQCILKLPKMFFRSKEIVQNVDIVNARVPDYTGLCGLYWAKVMSKPVFINIVDDWHTTRIDGATRTRGIIKWGLKTHLYIYSFIEQLLCKNLLVFAQGKHLYRIYSRYRNTYLTISSSHYKSNLVQSGKEYEKRKIVKLLAVGRMVYVKGHRDLIKAIKILKDNDSERHYELTIVGEGNDFKEYLELSRKLNIEKQIRLVGQVERKKIFNYYDKADLFCLPSISEGTPKVVLEAMARGLPVVASDVGGLRSVIKNRKSGLLVPPGNPEKIAEGIVCLLNDMRLYKRCADEGLRIAANHTVESEWGKMVSVIKEKYANLWKKEV